MFQQEPAAVRGGSLAESPRTRVAMMKFCLGALAALFVASGAHASPILIDFESVPPGSQMSYVESGVTFTTLTNSAFFRSETPAGTQGLLASDSLPFRADISGGATTVSVDLGDFASDAELLFLQAFDVFDNLLEQTLLPISSNFEGM